MLILFYVEIWTVRGTVFCPNRQKTISTVQPCRHPSEQAVRVTIPNRNPPTDFEVVMRGKDQHINMRQNCT